MPKYRFPDPALRSVKKPTTDCSREKIVGLYNQAHEANRTYLTDEIKDWFKVRAIGLGWRDVDIGQNAATLTADVSINAEESADEKGGNVISINRSQRSQG